MTDVLDPTPDHDVMKEVLARIHDRAAKKDSGNDVGPFVVDETFVKQLITTSMTLGRTLAFIRKGIPYEIALTMAVMSMHAEIIQE